MPVSSYNKAQEIAEDPQYEQVAARESAGEDVASGSASPPVSPAESGEEAS